MNILTQKPVGLQRFDSYFWCLNCKTIQSKDTDHIKKGKPLNKQNKNKVDRPDPRILSYVQVCHVGYMKNLYVVMVIAKRASALGIHKRKYVR